MSLLTTGSNTRLAATVCLCQADKVEEAFSLTYIVF